MFAEPRSRAAAVWRYLAALVLVLAAFTALAITLGRAPADEDASEIDDAVMIDLPPAEASSQPASDAPEGPEQQASQAAPAETAPPQVKPPKPIDKPPEEQPKPPPPETPPPPVAPDPAAVLERKKEETAPPPKPVVTPPTPAQEARAPTGSESPVITRSVETSDEGRPHASKHAITLWQRSLMQRLEMAKRIVDRTPHAIGTAAVAFRIDARGALASENIARSSGSATLDRTALGLVRTAAPFPPPPPGSSRRETFFVVPIRFR